MAKRTIVELVDDLDGKAADETVRFSLDGTSYEIDLSSKNADKFRGLFQDYIAAGTKVTGGRGKAGKKANTGTPTAEIRAWAEDKGLIEKGKKGRLPQNVLDAWDVK